MCDGVNNYLRTINCYNHMHFLFLFGIIIKYPHQEIWNLESGIWKRRAPRIASAVEYSEAVKRGEQDTSMELLDTATIDFVRVQHHIHRHN